MFCLLLVEAGERLVEVLHEAGVPAREVLGRSNPAQVRERLQRGGVAPRELDDARPGGAGESTRARSRGSLSTPQASAQLVAQLAPSGLGVLAGSSCLAPCTAAASDPRHRLDRGEHGVCVHDAAGVLAGGIEQRPKPPEPLDLQLHASAIGT
jgi:hypothetical protein